MPVTFFSASDFSASENAGRFARSLAAAVAGVLLLVSIRAALAAGDEVPRKIDAGVSQAPPTIDGVIDDREWKHAASVEIEMPFVDVKPAERSKRVCRLRVMNSANALYVALRVPDETVNKTLTPFDIDFGMLAFCAGRELAKGDDRKVVGPMVYVDKHFDVPGKDADDRHQDGRGAMRHEQGVSTIEWALPLDSGDDQDLRASPGDLVRFNVTYFDGFRATLDGTQIGTLAAGGLDDAAEWTTLRLAANVEDDGGAAFKGPAWVEALFKSFETAPLSRLKLKDWTLLPAEPQAVVKVLVDYTYRDTAGKNATAQAKIYLPAAAEGGQEKFPLFHAAGYELDDNAAIGRVRSGYVVVSPRGLEANPLVRTMSPDVALLHIGRALPMIDDSRVVIAGGSAGGYMTLMLAAETFPLAGAAADLPPVNWGYNAAYFLQDQARGAREADAPKTPVFDVIVPIARQAEQVYGPETSGATYYRNSPLAHLETITCPVAVLWSTADMLVPIDQVGRKWVRPFDATAFPPGFTMDPQKLTDSRDGRARFFDLLDEARYEIFVLSEETIRGLLAKAQESKTPIDLAHSARRQWSITILEEGAPQPQLGHLKYSVPWSQRSFLEQAIAGQIPVEQLTGRKLERLMDRYAGREWLPTPLKHLDDPETERRDVLRGLRTYIASGPEHARNFAALYAKLPSDRQVLPPAVTAELNGK